MKEIRKTAYRLLKIIQIRPKKLIICFTGNIHVTFYTPASKIFIAFSVFTLKTHLYITIVSLTWMSLPTFCLLIGCCNTKSKKFLEITQIHGFYKNFIKRIKITSRPPTSFSEKKYLKNIILIFWPHIHIFHSNGCT